MSAPSLSNFTAELRKRNVAKQSLFYVEIIPPTSIREQNTPTPTASSVNQLVSMWCHMATTPQVNISTNDDYIEAGVRRKYAYDQDYQNLTLTFYVDQGYEVKKFFDDWKYKIVPQRRNFNYAHDYTADKLNLYLINQESKNTYLYEYSRVFPKTIQSIELSYAAGVAIQTFAVEFVYEEVYFSKCNSDVISATETSRPPNPMSVPGDAVTNEFANNELIARLEEETRPIYDDSAPDMSGFEEHFGQPEPIISGGGGDFGGGATGYY